ncbi:hypothetical protein E0E52_07730 [Azotobacter chroococcum]|uniref:hypothetical protein n=1 Tax=Azotobacter chroococcum TaxID=353 RepID=UPI00103FDB39|nr:hypothetical protein [Azotobacter chroococcum]TBW09308.1 hypothetical protein E0E52_07730 [Azotobacter chroococcum]
MNAVLDTHLASQARRRARRSGSSKRTSRPLLILLGVTLAPLLLIGGTRLLFAGIASYQAEAFLQDWQKKGQAPNERAWQIAHDAAQRAIALYPGANGDYQHRLGQIHQWRQAIGAPAATRAHHAALAAFRAATQSRPAWPAHWLALAWTKLQLLEFDDEFHQALAEARRLGPWRIGINRGLVEVGLIAWPQLTTDEHSAVLEAARRTARFSTQEASKLLQLARQTGRVELICQSLDETMKKQRKVCL